MPVSFLLGYQNVGGTNDGKFVVCKRSTYDIANGNYPGMKPYTYLPLSEDQLKALVFIAHF